MFNRLLYFIIWLSFVLLSAPAVIGIEETNNAADEASSPLTGSAEITARIDFDSVIKKAQEHSYDLKAADFDILISKKAVISSRSDYFPKLTAGAGTDYTKNLHGFHNNTVVSAGGSFINPYTKYQNILGITLSYDIFDFGTRRNVLNASKEDVKIKELEEKIKLQDLKLNVLDIYAKVLIMQKQLDLFNKILELQEKNLDYSDRLYNAKELSSLELNTAKASCLKTKRQINDVSSLYEEALAYLSFYTGDSYDSEILRAESFDKSDFNPYGESYASKSPSVLVYDRKLKQKEYEIKAAKSMYFPKASLYAQYYLYGSNHSSYNKSLEIKPSNFSAGGSISAPLFDGFKTPAEVGIKRLELEKLLEERSRASAEYNRKLSIMRSNLKYSLKQLEDNEKIENELNIKAASAARLLKNSIISPIQENNIKIELINQQIESIKTETAVQALIKGIEILAEEY